MNKEKIEAETGVLLPDSGIINLEWAKEQLSRVDLFSASLLAYGRGEILYMLQTHLSATAYEQAVRELGFSVENSAVYIQYLQKRPVIEAIREKYYVALSLSASEYIPDATEDALAICDITVAKYGKLTADNIKKALVDTGTSIKKIGAAAITVEKNKRDLFLKWLKEEHKMTESDVLDASKLLPESKTIFLEKSIAAFDRLGDWNVFYSIIAKSVHDSDDMKALRFLADLNDAAPSMEEFLAAEESHAKLNTLKETFDNTIYPALSFQASK